MHKAYLPVKGTGPDLLQSTLYNADMQRGKVQGS